MSLLYEHESYNIRGAAFDVYKALGSGHKEVVYQRAYCIALIRRGLKPEMEKRIPVYFEGEAVGTYIPDCVVSNAIAIELKAKQFITTEDKKQFWHYMQSIGYTLGFLINFGKPGGVEIMRRVHEKAKQSVLRLSASDSAPFENGGFTLIELIIAIAVFTVLSLGVFALVSNAFTVNRQQGTLLANQDQARRMSFQLMTELRNASTSATGAYTIETAGTQQFVFYANADTTSDIERIRYYFQNGAIYKGVTKPSGSPSTYNLASETVTVVQNNIAGNPTLFTYYDDTYNGVTGVALVQPVSVTAIRFVKVDVPITNQAGVANTNSYTVTSMAAIRSLKTNLASTADPPPFPPTVDLQINSGQGPVTIAYNGTATLTWTSTNATSCTASGSWSGSVGTSGSQSTGSLTADQTYTIVCTGLGGTSSPDSVSVTVSPPPAPTVDILGNGSQGPLSIAYNTTVTLTWSSTTTTSCTASGSWSGSKATSGSSTTSGLTSNQTYTLQCTGPGGSASDSVVVNVGAPPPTPPTCVSAAPESGNANGNGTFYVYAYGVLDTTSLSFELSGPGTLTVVGTDQGANTWRGSIPLTSIPNKGWYTVDVYGTNASYSHVWCASTQFRRK